MSAWQRLSAVAGSSADPPLTQGQDVPAAPPPPGAPPPHPHPATHCAAPPRGPPGLTTFCNSKHALSDILSPLLLPHSYPPTNIQNTAQFDDATSDMKTRSRSDESSSTGSEGGSSSKHGHSHGSVGGTVLGAAEKAAKKLESATGSIPLPEYPPSEEMALDSDKGQGSRGTEGTAEGAFEGASGKEGTTQARAVSGDTGELGGGVMSVLAEGGFEGYMGQVGGLKAAGSEGVGEAGGAGAQNGVEIGPGEQQQQQGDRHATSFDSNSSGSGTMGGSPKFGGGDDALAGLSEQARITAAVMGVPYVPDLEQGMVENLAAAGFEGVTSAGQEQQQQMGIWGQQGKSGGMDTASMSLGGYIASAAAEATAAAAADSEGAARGGDPVTVSEERVLIRVSPDLGSSSQGREGSEGSDSAQGFSGGRIYDNTGSADFSSELWGPGVGEVVKESEYYAYRSVDDAGISGIGRRSSTGHRGSRQGDEDSA